jgi:hypothetical protein
MRDSVNPAVKPTTSANINKSTRKQYRDGKRKIFDRLIVENTSFAICSELMTDHWQDNFYMKVTCHWTDDEYIIQKGLLGYQMFDMEISGKNVTKLIKHVLQEYEIVRKISFISFDSLVPTMAPLKNLNEVCGTNFVGVKFTHIRVATHVFYLCVNNALTLLSVPDNLGDIRLALLRMWRHKNIYARVAPILQNK